MTSTGLAADAEYDDDDDQTSDRNGPSHQYYSPSFECECYVPTSIILSNRQDLLRCSV